MTQNEEKVFFLGIEATGRTVALLSNEAGEVVGKGTAGPSVYSIVGQEKCGQALWVAIISAFAMAGFNTRDLLAAGVALPEVKAICIGMTGIEKSKDEAAVRRIVAGFNLGSNIQVVPEARAVLKAGTEKENGVAIIAGESGSVFALGPGGRTARAGGGGYLIGDEGSAHQIGLEAIRAVLRSFDGRGEETELTPLVFQEWKLNPNRPDLLAGQVYKLATGPGTGGNKAQLEETTEGYKRALASLAPLVERASAKGDRVAGQLLDGVAGEISRSVKAVISRAGLEGETKSPSGGSNLSIFSLAGKAGLLKTDQPGIPLVCYGSAISSPYGELRGRVSRLLPECEPPLIVTNPAEGALLLATEENY